MNRKREKNRRNKGPAALLLALTLALAGCAKGEEAPALQAADYYRGLTQGSVTAEVAADSGVLMEYRLAVEWDEGGGTATVLAPEEIAGVRCRIGENGAWLEYEDVELETLLPNLPGFTPADCVDGLLDALAGGAPSEWAWEKKGQRECLALTYEAEAGGYQTLRRVWLDRQTLALAEAQWYLDGNQMMSASFTDFQAQ